MSFISIASEAYKYEYNDTNHLLMLTATLLKVYTQTQLLHIWKKKLAVA